MSLKHRTRKQAKVLWNFNTKHFFIDASQNSSVSLLARLWHKTLKVNCSQSNLAEERWGRQIPQVVPRLAFFFDPFVLPNEKILGRVRRETFFTKKRAILNTEQQ